MSISVETKQSTLEALRSSEGYFHRVQRLTPTRFWINNPTREEVEWAIAAGAISCTCNPSYSMKMIQGESQAYVLAVIDRVIREVPDDQEAADLIQQKLINEILEGFLPLYREHPGVQGFVSIQGNPLLDDDPHAIVEEALRYSKLGENFIAKIPATEAGLQAMESLISEGVPIIATEIMGVPQLVHTCELYARISRASGKFPPFYLTHITGIFDNHIKEAAKHSGVNISSDYLWQAGSIVARRQYEIWEERDYPGIILGGGARGLQHFTEFVGSKMHITINWNGTASELIAQNPPVVDRMKTIPTQHVVEELLEKIPDFAKAYLEDGLSVKEFKEFGPVQRFRESFIRGWTFLLSTIRYRRTLV